MSKRSITEAEQPFTLSASPGTPGPAKRVDRFDTSTAVVAFHSFAATPGSYDLEGTVDGNDWSKIQIGVTADVRIALTHYWTALRIHTQTPGAPNGPTVVLGAYELLY
jgi:hypothetical protein